jgi:hypothetical protein
MPKFWLALRDCLSSQVSINDVNMTMTLASLTQKGNNKNQERLNIFCAVVLPLFQSRANVLA